MLPGAAPAPDCALFQIPNYQQGRKLDPLRAQPGRHCHPRRPLRARLEPVRQSADWFRPRVSPPLFLSPKAYTHALRVAQSAIITPRWQAGDSRITTKRNKKALKST